MAPKKNNTHWYQKFDERLDAIDKTLVKQEENLRHHMYRTELAEKRIEQLDDDLKPIQDHVNTVSNIGKIIMWILGSGIIITAIEIFR